jgi:hypothetical protein
MIQTSKNSNVTSTWIAKMLESKIKVYPNMSYAIMKQELLDNYGIEPSNVAQLKISTRKKLLKGAIFHLS